MNLEAGDRLPLPADDLLEVSTMMESLWLPKIENKTITTGYHVPLGTQMQEGILRTSPYNDKYAEIISKINEMIWKVTQGRLKWNALEIYKNTVLRPQVKLEHDGLTA